VHPGGQEMLVHEAHHAFIRPHLGIQPSTAASHRGGAEVEEYWFLLGLRVLQHLINVTAKLDWHRMLPADVTSLEDSHAHRSPAPASKDGGSKRARRLCAQAGSCRTTRYLQVHPGPANIAANRFRVPLVKCHVMMRAPGCLLVKGAGEGEIRHVYEEPPKRH